MGNPLKQASLREKVAQGGPRFLAREEARPGQGQVPSAVATCLVAGSGRGYGATARNHGIPKESALLAHSRAGPASRFPPSKGFSGRSARAARPFLLPLNLSESHFPTAAPRGSMERSARSRGVHSDSTAPRALSHSSSSAAQESTCSPCTDDIRASTKPNAIRLRFVPWSPSAAWA